jgi:hypothetical protein
MKLKQCLMPGALGLAWMGLAAMGCDDSNTNPMPDDSVITAPKGGKSGSSQSGSKAGKGGEAASGKGGQAAPAQAGSGGQGGSSSGGAGGSAAGKGGSGGTGQTSSPVTANLDCKDKTDCFCGAPKQAADFLNQCTDAMCTHYDNSKLKKWNGEGAPPPLP